MIIDFNRYNGGGGSGSGVTPEQVQQQINSALTPYWESGETKDYVDGAVSGISLEGYATSGDMQSAFTLIQETQQVAAAGLNQLEGRIDELSGSSVDLSAYWTSAETQDAIDEAISGFTPSANSPIIPAITSQAEYGAISGDVKTGDLIQVNNVDINGDNNPEYGLFEAAVEEEEDGGVVRKLISWNRRDNGDSVFFSYDYPWMDDNGILPIDLGQNTFIISPDLAAEEDEAYNGIGFDEDGKPVITHFAPEYDDETGEVTGITREDTPIGGADMSAYYTSAQTEAAISAATAGKADAVSIEASNSGFKFPKWNSQGIITGKTGDFYLKNITLNGDSTIWASYSNYITQPNFYAPVSVGTAGDILVSTGSGAPVWSAVTMPDMSEYWTSAQTKAQIDELAAELSEAELVTSTSINDIKDNMVSSAYINTIWRGTQAEYDTLVLNDQIDNNTLYVIL